MTEWQYIASKWHIILELCGYWLDIATEINHKVNRMSKELLVSDESVNSYNVIVKTDGGDFKRFNDNPIMLFNHIRAINSRKDNILPIGTWKDFRVDGADIYATPVFDLKDKFAKKIAGKYERGVLRSASIGLMPLKIELFGEDDNNNTIYIVTKWELREISIVDIPSNANAVHFVDSDDQPLELNDVLNMAANPVNNKKGNSEMTKFQFVPALLGLSASASDDTVKAEIEKLMQLKVENSTLKQSNIDLKAQNKTLSDQIAEQGKKDALELVDQAIKDQKITADQKDNYINLFEKDFDSTKSILEAMKPAVNLSDLTNNKKDFGKDDSGKVTYKGMTFSELRQKDSAALVELKTKDQKTFNELYKSEFGVDYKF